MLTSTKAEPNVANFNHEISLGLIILDEYCDENLMKTSKGKLFSHQRVATLQK